MTVAVATLERRSAAQLRAFVRAQHVEVERHPDRVTQPVAFLNFVVYIYRRFLLRRAPLEGICRYYETYNADGSENDWCILIDPDPPYSWMVDPEVLSSLSLLAGWQMDLDEIKEVDDFPVIECEITPDNGLYDKFLTGGLPIQSGGDAAENQHEGPEGSRVGVYGVFCGDYGHRGRPEIHPFDAFWRRCHGTGRDSTISWDLGVFQDDSNRFNDDWSKAPIDVEFRIPFCVDVPVTFRTSETRRARFVLRRSDLCTVVGKNTRDENAPDLTETFTARTVRLNPNRENRVEISVEDATGLSGRPFRLGFEDVTFTTTSSFGLFSQRAWLAGHIVVRVAIDQDGFVYWNLRGPNSTTAADAAGDDAIVTGPDEVKGLRRRADEPPRPRPAAVKVTGVRPVVSTDKKPAIAADVVVAVGRDDGLAATERVVRVRARETPLIVDEATGRTVELESFDLFALASAGPPRGTPTRMPADISESIGRLAGLQALERRRAAQPAIVEVDDYVTVDIAARYAPFRDGKVQGEEQSRLSESLNNAATGSVEVRGDVNFTDAQGTLHRIRTGDDVAPRAHDGVHVRVEAAEGGHRLIVGPLGRVPTVVKVDATVEDQFGLRSEVSAVAPNYRVVDARPWVEEATGTSLVELRQRNHEVNRLARLAPTDAARASAGLLRCLVEVIEALDRERAVPATEVAGAVRLAARVKELVSRAPGR